VDEDVRLAQDDRGCLRPGGAERRELAADRLGEGLREGRRPGAADDDARPSALRRGKLGRLAGREDDAARGEGDGTGDGLVPDDEGDVDGPVLAARLAELPRAVERIDDPGAAAALARALALLREHRLARALLGEPPDDQLVRAPVAFGGVGVRANREQERSGLRRDARGKTIFVR
jgi:hypothetical protein